MPHATSKSQRAGISRFIFRFFYHETGNLHENHFFFQLLGSDDSEPNDEVERPSQR